MKRILSLMLVLAVIFTSLASVQIVSAADTIDEIFANSGDAYLDYNARKQNDKHGAKEVLLAKSNMTLAFKFNVAEHLLGYEAESVELNLFITEAREGTSLVVNSMTDQTEKQWIESTVCANDIGNKPALNPETVEYTFETDVANEWIAIDVTNLVNAEGDKLISFYVTSTSSNYIRVASKEYVDADSAGGYGAYLHATGALTEQSLDVASVEFDVTEATLLEGVGTLQINATVSPAYAVNKKLIWTSSDETVATVSDKGLVTAISGGDGYQECTITATSEGNPEAFAVCEIRVEKVGGEGSEEYVIAASDTTSYDSTWGNDWSTSNIKIKGTGGSTKHGYVKVKAPELVGYDISYAQLEVKSVSVNTVNGPLTVTLEGITYDDWDAAAVGADQGGLNCPERETGAMLVPISAQTVTQPETTYVWEVTDFIKNYADGVYSFRFTSGSSDEDLTLYPKGAKDEPKLVVIARPYILDTAGDSVAVESIFAEGKGDDSQLLIAGTFDEDGVLTAINSAEVTAGSNGALNVALSDETYSKFFTFDSIENAIPRKTAYKHNSGIAEFKYSAVKTDGVSVDDTLVTISGVAAAGENVGLTVIKPEVALADAAIADVVSVAQVTADANGRYTFAFNMPESAVNGMYEYAIGGSTTGEVIKSKFFYADPDSSTSVVIEALAASETTKDTSDIMTAMANKLGLSTNSVYKYYLGIEDKEPILQGITDDLEASDTVADIIDTIVLYIVDGEDNADTLNSFIGTCYKELLGSSYEDKYEGLSGTKKSNVAKDVRGNYTSANSFVLSLEAEIDEEVESKKTTGPSGNGPSKSTTIYGADLEDLPLPTAAPTEAPVTEKKFTDLAGYEWAEGYISDLAAKGIISGNGDGTFAPGSDVTREQFVKMLIEGFGLTEANAECDFADVSKSDWYYSVVATANKLGIVKGIDESTFGVGQKITRQDMAVMAYRTAIVAGMTFDKEGSLDFSDNASISDYAVEAVGIMQANGIITGMGDGTFAPLSNANRAQAATIIWKLLN